MSYSPPYFDVQASYHCKMNRLYRIFLEEDAFTFVWLGTPGSEFASAGLAGSASGGLVGAIVGNVLQGTFSNAKGAEDRAAQVRSKSFEELRGDHAENFAVAPDAILSARLGPRSRWHAGEFSDPHHVALLTVRTASHGKQRLGLRTLEGIHTAVHELPRILGERCRVDLVWSEFAGAYLPRP